MTENSSSPFQVFRETKFFASLDGLRSLAILAVIWQHGYSGHGVPHNVFGRGHHGVGLFFAISGFLITTLLLRERDRNGHIDYRAFFTRRALRIFPLYYAILAIYFTMVTVLDGHPARTQLFYDNLPYHFVYLSNWCPTGTFGFAWSLATEEQFYLVWPWILILLPKRAPIFVVLGIWGLKLFLYREVAAGNLDGLWFPTLFFRKISDSILAGICLAWLLHHRRSFAIIRPVLAFPLAPFVYLGLCLWLLNGHYHHEEWGYLSLAFALFIGSAIIREDHSARAILTFPALSRIGVVSYGMYLTHQIFMSGISRLADTQIPQASFLRFAITTLLAFLAASLSYRYFETPFLNLKKRFSR
ncbi:MAG: acyltransferase [Planctomycetota bacterium]